MAVTKPPAKTPGANALRLTKAEIDRYFALEAERKELQRKAKDLAALQDEIELKMTAFVEAKGGPERALVSCGYRLAIIQCNGTVSWKSEFLRVAGHDAAEALIASAPKRDVLQVEPT